MNLSFRKLLLWTVLMISITAITASTGHSATIYFSDFEANNGGLSGTLDWEWGLYSWAGGTCASGYEPTAAHSGTHMWGTVLNNCYTNYGNNDGYNTCVATNPGDDSILTFTIDLTGYSDATLSWWEWVDLFFDWDWGEVYANGTVIFQHCDESPARYWASQTVDLTPYVGGMVTIEFHMSASTVVEYSGWYIDDLEVTVSATPTPTPVGTWYTDTPTSTPTFTDTPVATDTPTPPMWTDMDNANAYQGSTVGCTWDWYDLDDPTITWTALGASDSTMHTVNMNMAFMYYEQIYTQVVVSSNGWIGFDSSYSSSDGGNDPIPNTNTPNNILAPFWDDLDAGNSGSDAEVYVTTIGTSYPRKFVVLYDQMQYWLSPYGSLTFQVVLDEATGEIKFQYATMDYDTRSWTYSIGIENENGTIGLEYPTGTLGDPDYGLAICWRQINPLPSPTPIPSWHVVDDPSRPWYEGLNHLTGSCPYSWIPIDSTWTQVMDGSSPTYVDVTMPFDFDFYGILYTEGVDDLRISRYGYLFNPGELHTSSNDPIPSTSTPNGGIICPFWDLQYPYNAGDAVYYKTFGTAPNRYFVVTWNEMYRSTSASTTWGPYTYQAILYEGTNSIKFQYYEMEGPYGNGYDASVGIEHPNGTRGIQYEETNPVSPYGDGETYAGLALCFNNMGITNEDPVADPNGPYSAECTGSPTSLILDGTGSTDADGDPLNYLWTTDCPGGVFDDETSATPVLSFLFDPPPCPFSCTVTLEASDEYGGSSSASTTVEVTDSTPPTVDCTFEQQYMIVDEYVDDEDEDWEFNITYTGVSGELLMTTDTEYDFIAIDDPDVTWDLVTSTADDSTFTQTLPFPFTFYGTEYNSFYISSNGFVGFGTPETSLTNYTIPSTSGVENMIAVFWDDLDFDPNADGIYTTTIGTAPDRIYVILYNEAFHFSGATLANGPMTFEILLYEGSNNIKLQYEEMQGNYADGYSATVGIENADGTEGILYSYNTAGAVYEGLAILFYEMEYPLANGIYRVFYDAFDSCDAFIDTVGYIDAFDPHDEDDETSCEKDPMFMGYPVFNGELVQLICQDKPDCWADEEEEDPLPPPVASDGVYNAYWPVAIDWIDPVDWTSAGLGSDDTITVPMGFNFNYYGNSYDTVTISDNGWIGFDSYSSSYPNDVEIPDTAAPNNIIAPIWDNLYGGTPYDPLADVLYTTIGTAPNRIFGVTWYHMPKCCTSSYSGWNTFQVLLYESTNEIMFQYNEIESAPGGDENDGHWSTVGIENSDGTMGIQYQHYEAGSMYSGLGIQFIPGSLPPEYPVVIIKGPGMKLMVEAVDGCANAGYSTCYEWCDEDWEPPLPPCPESTVWTQMMYGGTGVWEWVPYPDTYDPPQEGLYYMEADSDDNSSDVYDVGLFSPVIDLSGLTSVTLEFGMNFQDYAGCGDAEVRVYSCGVLEETLYSITTDSSAHYETFTFDPSGYTSPASVQFEFWYSTGGDTYCWSFSVDDITVSSGGTPIFTEDFEAYPF